MKATLHIDEVKYNAKPNGRQVMNRIKKGDNVVDAEPTQLLEAVTSGQTVVLGEFSPAPFVNDGKLIQQSYFMLDFDNTIKVMESVRALMGNKRLNPLWE